jgi:hypothetical protein
MTPLQEYAKLKRAQSVPNQPAKCVGCVWGRWCGTKQYCSRQACVRE